MSFIKPTYNHSCFADIPAILNYWLTGNGSPSLTSKITNQLSSSTYETVILLLIDGMGWRFVEPILNQHPLLQRFSQKGVVEQLTSMFPSTTAAHVTCIHTGLPPAQSGVYEWAYYEPQLNEIIKPLLFSFGHDKHRNTLKSTKIKPKQLYPPHTLYQQLALNGVTSYVFQYRGYTPSPYSDWVFRGANVIPYRTLPEALTNMNLVLEQIQQRPLYCMFYIDVVDGICHEYGPTSPQLYAELDTVLTTIDRLLWQSLSTKRANTLLAITADHGLVEVAPQTTIYLNREPCLKEIANLFQTNQQGKPIVPAGSPRDMFLYVKPTNLSEAQQQLSEVLAGKAEVWRTDTLIEQGYFGPTPVSDVFQTRVGNLVILPYAKQTVWWYEENLYEMNFYGHHGGLTPSEMEIPLLLYEFGLS